MGIKIIPKVLMAIFVVTCQSDGLNDAQSSNSTRVIACDNGQYIPRFNVCDGIRHCEDGSDEIYDRPGFKCVLSAFHGKPNSKRCVLPISMISDVIPDCQDNSDLCFDSKSGLIGSKCFQCLNGSHVVSLTQVCDGTIDCPDLSDECTCLKAKLKNKNRRKLSRHPICDQIKYPSTPHWQKDSQNVSMMVENDCQVGDVVCKLSDSQKASPTNLCVKPSQICDNKIDCPLGDDEEYCIKAGYNCTGQNEVTGIFCDGRIDCPNFDDECNDKCWLSNNFCDSLINFGDNSTSLSCMSPEENSTAKFGEFVNASDVCNGIMDCETNGRDEANCLASTHFYCAGEQRPLFVNWTNYLDGVRDCVFGDDECGGQARSSQFDFLKTKDAIIRSEIMVVTAFSFGLMALVGNAAVFYHASRELWKDYRDSKLGKLAKCNRILVSNLAMSDFLMGVYLLCIGFVSVLSNGKYCAKDREWRSGYLCIGLGFTCQISSQTSVMTLILMTTYRLYGTLKPFEAELSRVVNSSLICCALVWTLSITISLIPLLDSFSHYFNSRVWTPLPMVPADVLDTEEFKEFVIRINTLTDGNTSQFNDYSLRNMMRLLGGTNIKGIRENWNINTTQPYGYYNWYPLCIPNLYPRTGDTAWVYSAVLISFDFIAFVYITISYFIIYKASSRPAVRKSVRKRSKQWRKDNKAMQRKILLLVFTDVSCWFPICIMAFINLVHPITMRRDIVGITASLLLPINSAVNPLIYSSAFWNMLRLLKTKIRPDKRKESLFVLMKSRENSVTSQASNVSNLNARRLINYRYSTDQEIGTASISATDQRALLDSCQSQTINPTLPDVTDNHQRVLRFSKLPSKCRENESSTESDINRETIL